MVRGLVLAISLVLALGGCVSQQQQIEAASQIRVTDDQFQPFKEYSTGKLWSFDTKFFSEVTLGARLDRKTGALSTILEFLVSYNTDARYNYKVARNNKAELLKLSALQRRSHNCIRKEDTCDHKEILQVEIPESDLRQAPSEGYAVKLFPAVGPAQLVTVPKQLIVSLLAKVDADRGGPAAQAPAPQTKPETKPVASAAH